VLICALLEGARPLGRSKMGKSSRAPAGPGRVLQRSFVDEAGGRWFVRATLGSPSKERNIRRSLAETLTYGGCRQIDEFPENIGRERQTIVCRPKLGLPSSTRQGAKLGSARKELVASPGPQLPFRARVG